MTKRKRPAPPQDRPSSEHNGFQHSTAEPPRYGIKSYPLDDETRRDAHLTAIAYSLGFRLAVRCQECGHWLIAESSVRAHLGPRCAAKRAKAVVA